MTQQDMPNVGTLGHLGHGGLAEEFTELMVKMVAGTGIVAIITDGETVRGIDAAEWFNDGPTWPEEIDKLQLLVRQDLPRVYELKALEPIVPYQLFPEKRNRQPCGPVRRRGKRKVRNY